MVEEQQFGIRMSSETQQRVKAFITKSVSPIQVESQTQMYVQGIERALPLASFSQDIPNSVRNESA